MSVVVKNLQKAAVLNLWVVRKDLFLLRNIMGLHSFDVGLIFVSKRKQQKYNRKYRQKDEPTDILSFPFHEHFSNKSDLDLNVEEKNLGDIFLCPEIIMKKYNTEEHELRKTIVPLLCHGLCHLCGYVHENDVQHEMMTAKEIEILSIFSKRTGKVFSPVVG